MKFSIKDNQIGNYKVFLRRAGYAAIFDRRRGVESFVLRLGRGHYPRLHLYPEQIGDSLIFSLHLDQKKTSYEGFSRHNAEYEAEIVQQEVERLKSLIPAGSNESKASASESSDFSLSGDFASDLKRLKATTTARKRFWFFK